jgi:hypothetical protein
MLKGFTKYRYSYKVERCKKNNPRGLIKEDPASRRSCIKIDA